MSIQGKTAYRFKKMIMPTLLIIGICAYLAIPPLLSVSSGSFYTKCKYIAYAMKKGYLPYKDLYDHTGILFYFINCFGIKINYDLGIIWIQIILMAIGIIFSYRTVSLFTDDKIAFLAVMTGFVLNAGLYTGEDYTVAMISVCLFYGISFLKGRRMKTADCFFYGVCLACTLFLSIGMGILLIAAGVMFGTVKILHEKKLRFSGSCMMIGLLGSAVITVPVLGYLFVHNLFELWFEMVVLYALNGLQLFSGAALLSGMEAPFAYIMFVAVVYVIYLLLMNHETDHKDVTGMCVSMLAIMLLIGIRETYPFIAVSLIPLTCLLYGKVFEYLIDKSKNLCVSGGTYLMAAVMVSLNLWISADYLYTAAGEHGFWKASEADGELISDIRNLIQTVDELDGRISVFGDWNYIYSKTRKISDSKYFYLFPLIEREPEVLEEYLQELLEKETFLVIIDDQDTYQDPFYKDLRQAFRQWLETHQYYSVDLGKKYYFKYYEE